MKNTRRSFLKKVVYTAPVIAALGTLTSPADLEAARGDTKPDKSGQTIGSNVEYTPILKDKVV